MVRVVELEGVILDRLEVALNCSTVPSRYPDFTTVAVTLQPGAVIITNTSPGVVKHQVWSVCRRVLT